ncbi:MAG: MBL fold metallo-hydrolase [Deltaproteobacteria bacterium]|jgi:glyoxylase-like metal-dependent hydrolase (beta-lactamase superfamily II)|nr:MBL fold metallo-hydrolase [Deltaproteobacteria bacterium]
MEIIRNVWQVGGTGFTAPDDAAIYLVRWGEKAALIDAGCGNAHEKLVENVSAVVPPEVAIEYLLLTHCHYDHTGGAAAVRRQYGCAIAAHQLDAVYLEKGDNRVTAASWYGTRMEPLQIDYKIGGSKEILKIGSGEITAYHCPGHSPGSLVFTVEVEGKRILFGQDVHGPLDASLLSNTQEYRNSLSFLLDLNADVLCEGHFGVYQGKDEVERFIRSYLNS